MLDALLDPLGLVRGINFSATILAAGTVAFMALVLVPDPPLRARLIQVAWAAIIVTVLSGLAWLALVAAAILGVPMSDLWRSDGLWSVATETRFGRIICARTAIGVVLALTLIGRAPGWFALVLAGVLLGLLAWTGHAGAAAGARGWIHLASDLVHVLAAGLWLGSLPALALLLLARREGDGAVAAGATARFSMLGMACVAALLASGLINSWLLLGSVADLATTTYGRLLAVKIVLFAAMVGIAAVNRMRLTPRLPAAGAALARNALVETAFGLAVVLIAGALGTMPPPGHMHNSSSATPEGLVFVHIHSSQAMADVTIDPGPTGNSAISIKLWHENQTPFEAKSVRVTLDAREPGHPRLEDGAIVGPDSTWTVPQVRIPAAGVWTIRVLIDPDGQRPIVLDAPVVITQCSNEC